jgi:hypothetical protein
MPSKCKIFPGKTNKKGYGYVGHTNGVHLAHRLAWMLHHGKCPPRGKVIMHVCDNPTCIEPQHLILGTYKDNFQDAIKKGRIDPRKSNPNGRPKKIKTS